VDCRNEGDTTWSPFDVVGHLIHGERTDWILARESSWQMGRRVPSTQFDRLAQFAVVEDRSLPALLDEFAGLRPAESRGTQSTPC
jgi:hypothetical protein